MSKLPAEWQPYVDKLEAQLENIQATRRWNTELEGDDLLVCHGEHERHEGCDWIRYVPKTKYEELQAQLAENSELITMLDKTIDEHVIDNEKLQAQLELAPFTTLPSNVYAPDNVSWQTHCEKLQAQLAEREWQPIEIAPKNKVLLLGYRNSHGNWRTLRGRWVTQIEIDEDWYDIDGYDMNHCYEGWFEESVEAEDAPNMWPTTPTHWMPLPEALQEKGDE